MRHGRHLAAAALTGALALSLVAADTPSAGAQGTATTSLSAIELAITSPVGDAAVSVVDAATFASTATDPAANPAGVPFASAALTPLTGPAGPVGHTEARSDGATAATAEGTTLDAFGGPVADLSGTVSPVTLTATAAADEAEAVIDTLTAQVAGLAGALGITVDATGAASHVTGERASATQGLHVSELAVTLGDIVPQDVLASLPLPDLLAFLEALPVDLPADAQSSIGELRSTIDALRAQLVQVQDEAAAVEAKLAELEDAEETLEALRQLADLEAELALLDQDDPQVDETIGAIGDAVDTIGGSLGSVLFSTTSTEGQRTAASSHDCGSATTAEELQACIDALEAELVGDVGSVADLEALVAALVVELESLVDDLLTSTDDLVPLLGDVTTVAADLTDLLTGLEDLLADAAGTPLVAVSAFDIGVNALSDGSVDGSSAAVLCQPVTITVLGESITTPSCEDGLSAVTDATALVDGLLGTLTDTLNVLPLTDVLTTGALRADLFTDLQHSVVEEGDAVVATAGVTALDLEVPSFTIDPEPVTDLFGQLGLLDVLGTVDGLLGDTLARVEALDLPGLDPVTAALSGAIDELGAPGGIADLVAQLEGVLAGLDLGELGTLERVSTPSVALVIDPVSTASFAPAPGSPSNPPAPDGDDPTPTPTLPNTGGGLGLLGLATLAGAYALRRRG